MENKPVEQSSDIAHISDIPRAMPMSGSKVKDMKRVALKGKPCIYFKDMQCRAPVCDMKACEKCPEGTFLCARINFIKRMVQRILMIFVSMIFLFEL